MTSLPGDANRHQCHTRGRFLRCPYSGGFPRRRFTLRRSKCQLTPLSARRPWHLGCRRAGASLLLISITTTREGIYTMLDSERAALAALNGWPCAVCRGPGWTVGSGDSGVALCAEHKSSQITVEDIWQGLSADEKHLLLIPYRGRPHIASARTQFSDRCRHLGVTSNAMGDVIRADPSTKDLLSPSSLPPRSPAPPSP